MCKIKKKSHILFLFLALGVFLHSGAYCQFQQEVKKESDSKFDRSKLRFGGDFWVSFGKLTFINCSPKVGYQLNKRFVPGIGVIAQYYKDERFFPNVDQVKILGGSVMASYILVDSFEDLINIDLGGLIAHVQYDYMNINYMQSYTLSGSSSSFWVSRFLVGGGIRYKVSPRSSINLLVLWDLIGSPYSPDQNPMIQFGLSL